MPVIDIHAHYVSPELMGEAARNGAHYSVDLQNDATGKQKLIIANTAPLRPMFAELCNLTLRLPMLKAYGIDRQVISTWTDLAGDELPREQAARWSRLQNDTLADAARAMPERFEAMGTLPMQHPDLAIAELEHIVHHIGMRSVEIGTNINGRDLDHEEFRGLWKRLAELDVFVLLHPPRVPVGMNRVGDYFLNNLIAYPTDTTIAAARLLFSGILHDYPALKCCLAHGGGFLPYQIGRFDRGFAAHPACKSRISKPPSDYLRSFYYDSLTHHTQGLAYLIALVGPDKVLFGSDYPFEMVDEAGPARVRGVSGLAAAAREAILGENAQTLLRNPAANPYPPISD
jgi:aminocarboxymuconate-semialdehyde decarboxylase